MIIQTDVMVIGGGTSGSVAAIQAASAGARTVLVEANSILGGTISVDSVNYPGLFHAHGSQIIKGIGWKLIEEAVKMNNDKLQDFSKPFNKSHNEHHIHINKDIFALLLEEKCAEVGVQLRYYETPIKVKFSNGYWYVELAGKGTNLTYKCNQLVDCTGNAALTILAGFKVNHSKVTQPGSLMFKLSGYDIERLNFKLLQDEYEKAIDNGSIKKEEFFGSIKNFLTTVYDKRKINTFSNHIYKADSTTSVTHTKSNIYSRKALLNILRILSTFHGLENITLSYMSPQTAVRETNTIDAVHNITADDYICGKRYHDAICYSFYPIDLHTSEGVKPKQISKGIVPEVPLRALIPKGSKNLVVGGRCIGSDQLANSALRVQGTCMATGQAAGAVAAIASKQRITPFEVPLGEIKKLLLNSDAIVPE